jgi:phosphonatase-like hydrolase
MSANIKIELIVFDIIGTIVDDGGIEQKCMRAALSSAGLRVNTKAIHKVQGLAKTEAIRTLVSEFDISLRVADQWREVYSDFSIWMQRCFQLDPSVRVVEGAPEVFALLKKSGIKIALSSSFNRSLVDVLTERFGWNLPGAVDAIIATDEVDRGRPHPDMIQRLMKELGVQSAANVLKVGDTPEDLLEGRKAGCGLVFGVAAGAFTREQLRRYPHDDILDSIVDLPQKLNLIPSSNGKVSTRLTRTTKIA